MLDPREVLPPEALLKHLHQVLPDMTLIGSYARDYWVIAVAGMQDMARTEDVDFTIAVSSLEEYRDRVGALGHLHGTRFALTLDGCSTS